MKPELISRLHHDFEQIVQHELNSEAEFWLARDLQRVLEYSEWRNFERVIDKAKSACANAGYDQHDHFVDINKMVNLGSGAERSVQDIALTR